MGDFTQVMVGVRSQLELRVLQEAFAVNNQIGFVVTMRADVQLAHPQSFVKLPLTTGS